MPDPSQSAESPDTTAPVRAPSTRDKIRPVLWLLLVFSAAANVVASAAGANVFVGSGFGLVAVACATALIVDHYRHRRR
ncbi:hypothetical protein AB0J90_13855 [Micromonospora sp. NPDC049523]|uniref:hypothetical protein n=1 Tax=Micromonospora sp. NPDC049523 TaxID=3155921 RepID=UPI00344A3863